MVYLRGYISYRDGYEPHNMDLMFNTVSLGLYYKSSGYRYLVQYIKMYDIKASAYPW